MKFLALLLIASPISAFACNSFIADSEAPKAILLLPGAGAKLCGGIDPCVCFDGVDFEISDYDSVNKRFTLSAAKKSARDTRLAAEAAAAAQELSDRQDLLLNYQARIDTAIDGAATVADLKTAIKAILKRIVRHTLK